MTDRVTISHAFLPLAAALVGLALGHAAARAQQPERLPPAAVWTPTADAPEGLLTPLEGERHDRFIERARAGDIDIVFFGTTDTEMWLWADRGRSVWNRAFGSLRAASFGSQGTRVESLLWRMRNGELDGYRAKLVVLQTLGPGDQAIRADRLAEFIAGHAAIIAEIRARQPEARILLFAALPRGQVSRAFRRQIAEANAAAVDELVDDEHVFYIDIGDRFYQADGSFRDETWSLDPANRGRQTSAFDLWAEALQPWIDRFVR